MLFLASFRLSNNVIEAHAVEFDLDVDGPCKVVAAVHGKLIKLLRNVRHVCTINVQDQRMSVIRNLQDYDYV